MYFYFYSIFNVGCYVAVNVNVAAIYLDVIIF